MSEDKTTEATTVFLVPQQVMSLMAESALCEILGDKVGAARYEAKARQYIEDHPEQCGKIINVGKEPEGGRAMIEFIEGVRQ